MGGLNKGPALGRCDIRAAAQAIAKGWPNRELRTTSNLSKAETRECKDARPLIWHSHSMLSPRFAMEDHRPASS